MEELWQRDLDSARRGTAWKALLLDGLSFHTRKASHDYESLCQTPSPYDAVITQDIGRTLPREDLFREKCGKGQGALFRLLRALAVHLWDIGYVQSLNFVVATLICVFPDDEALVFHCAQALLFRHALADFYRPRFPKLGVTVWQFDRIVEGFLPQVHHTLQKHGVTAEYYAMQWFLALFAGDLPQPVVRRIWDRFLIAGWQVIVQVGLALLQQVQGELETFDTCEVLTFLKKFVRVRHYKTEELLHAAGCFEVSHRMLSELEAAYSGGVDAQLVVDTSGGKTRWAVQRRPSLASFTRFGVEGPKTPCSNSSPSQGGTNQEAQLMQGKVSGGTPQSAEMGTVLPFLLHNLDTGETTLMEEEWSKYMQEVVHPVSPPRCGQEPPRQRASSLQEVGPPNPATGGSFWLESRRKQALRTLGKV